MQVGDIVKAKNNDGRYATGTELKVIQIMSDKHEKPIRVRTLYGQCEAWYKRENLVAK